MMFNGQTVTMNGQIDTPWSDDFKALSKDLEEQAKTVNQHEIDISALKESVGELQKGTASGPTMTSILTSGTATFHSFTPAEYDILLIGATPSSSSRIICTSIPAACAVAGLAFQVADEQNYTKWDLSATGIIRNDGTGVLQYIYGVKYNASNGA